MPATTTDDCLDPAVRIGALVVRPLLILEGRFGVAPAALMGLLVRSVPRVIFRPEALEALISVLSTWKWSVDKGCFTLGWATITARIFATMSSSSGRSTKQNGPRHINVRMPGDRRDKRSYPSRSITSRSERNEKNTCGQHCPQLRGPVRGGFIGHRLVVPIARGSGLPRDPAFSRSACA